MCTGEINAYKGDILISGYSIRKQRYKARQNLGYCPQFDCLPEYLTVNETIKLFAELRGIDLKNAKTLSLDMLEIFQLKEFKNVLVQNLRLEIIF